MIGHCSNCHRVWTLEKGQGLCPWCGKLAVCQTSRAQALRTIKSRSNNRERQAEPNHNGYDQLEGEWLTYYKVASQFSHKSRVEDREDLLHDIMITLADVERNNGHKPFTEAVMYRIASRAVADYWRNQYEITNGLDCGHCGKVQKQKCRSEDLYIECPKAIKLVDLDIPIIDIEGNATNLVEVIADDKALDITEWTSPSFFLLGYPKRLVAIAEKIHEGQTLTNREHQYLWRFRQKTQKSLV